MPWRVLLCLGDLRYWGNQPRQLRAVEGSGEVLGLIIRAAAEALGEHIKGGFPFISLL